MKLLWLIILIFIFPASASAAVYFTEVAWMGSTESANHEWIELHNDGSAVDLDGWKVIDKDNLSIDLSGTIPAGSYAVLERISDSSAPGSAFLIYSGSLVNSGATLQLVRPNGSLVDQVSGGVDWENLGGDNETKETAQYTSSGWVTALATPGKKASDSYTATDYNQDNNDDKEAEVYDNDSKVTLNQTVAKSGGSGESSLRLSLPSVGFKLVINSPDTGYVNQPIKFTSTASGIGSSLINSLEYVWNFGNGDTSNLNNPEYVFKYPGKYVVTLFAGYKRQEQIARHEITILPIALSLNTNRNGDVVINNQSKYEVDLSNYRLKGNETFVLPPRTFLLPNQSITIAGAKIGNTAESLIMIYDAEGVAVDMMSPSSLLATDSVRETSVIDRSPTPMISAISTNREPPTSEVNQQFNFATNKPVDPKETLVTTETNSKVEEETKLAFGQLANANQNSPEEQQNWPYLALIGLIVLGIFGAVISKKGNQSD